MVQQVRVSFSLRPELSPHTSNVFWNNYTDKASATVTSVKVQVPKPVFEIKHWEAPDLPNDGLNDNPCWPSGLVPNDPGFALLTNDPWYDNHPKQAATAAHYHEPPSHAVLAKGNRPTKRSLRQKELQRRISEQGLSLDNTSSDHSYDEVEDDDIEDEQGEHLIYYHVKQASAFTPTNVEATATDLSAPTATPYEQNQARSMVGAGLPNITPSPRLV